MWKKIQEMYRHYAYLYDVYKYRYSEEQGFAWECDLCLAEVAQLGHCPRC